MNEWYQVENVDRILSPALLFYRDRIQHNIERMVSIAGRPERLRPHVKTHKCPEVIQMQLAAGIDKFKCATLAETEMLLESGVKDILLAYPPVGPAVEKYRSMAAANPEVRFACLIDSREQLDCWNGEGPPTRFYLDIDVGMSRTGIAPPPDLAACQSGAPAAELYDAVVSSGHEFGGLHVYDGHIRTEAVSEREAVAEDAFARLEPLLQYIGEGREEPFEIVCGGSITFPLHAGKENRTLSPGTTLLWDWGYDSRFPDVGFEFAAMVLTRIISKPGENRLCLDLGHKSVGSEMADLPVHFPQLPEAKPLIHSEEHLVVEVDNADDWSVGQEIYGIPRHVCPTVALHEQAMIIENGAWTDQWQITARKRLYQL